MNNRGYVQFPVHISGSKFQILTMKLLKKLIFSNCEHTIYGNAILKPVSSEWNDLRRLTGSVNKVLTNDNVFANFKFIEYPGSKSPFLVRAYEIEKELLKGNMKSFEEVIKGNVGDAIAMGQKPITFLRQVLALAILPELLKDPQYPDDAKNRVRTILKNCNGNNVGSYSASPGIEIIRRHIAEYIQERDGFPSDYNNIILSNGTSDGIKSFLKLFNESINEKPSGVMIPIPQYPLYSAILSEYGLSQIGYYLNEENKWSLDISELERSYSEAEKNCNPRVLVVINPGNPTGQVLSHENIQDIVKFAHKRRLFLLADEVYQTNVYGENSKFHSFKKVINEMGDPYSHMELASFMSISKGYTGECGLRGGYAEIVNMDSDVMSLFLKSFSAVLCPNILGQIAMEVVVNPPKPDEPSYPIFIKEKTETLKSLAKKSYLMTETLNTIPGYKVNPAMGSIFVFPRIEFPQKAIEAAKKVNQSPDLFYTFKLLEATGICVLAGSWFGQKPETYHFRTTILPQKERVTKMLTSLKEFHLKFLEEYS